MISFDTNIAVAMTVPGIPSHAEGLAFYDLLRGRNDVVVSEFMLLELYVILRNPAVVPSELTAAAAVDVCHGLRTNPSWQLVALPPDSGSFHEDLWNRLRAPELARRRTYDLRMALSLRYFGVDEFATANLRDFQDVGFARVWNPLADT